MFKKTLYVPVHICASCVYVFLTDVFTYKIDHCFSIGLVTAPESTDILITSCGSPAVRAPLLRQWSGSISGSSFTGSAFDTKHSF